MASENLRAYVVLAKYHAPNRSKIGPKHFDFVPQTYILAEPKIQTLANEQASVIFDNRFIIPARFVRELNPAEVQAVIEAKALQMQIDEKTGGNSFDPNDMLNVNVKTVADQEVAQTETIEQTTNTGGFKALDLKKINQKAQNYALGAGVGGLVMFFIASATKQGVVVKIIMVASGVIAGGWGFNYMRKKIEEKQNLTTSNDKAN